MQFPRIGRRPAVISRRGPLAGAVFAGALAGALTGMAGSASAQYYEDIEVYGHAPAYGRGFIGRDYYGEAPRPPRRVARIAARDIGLAEIERTVRRQGATIVDGRRFDGSRVRLIFDGYSGALLDRILLSGPVRQPAPPRVARVDPRPDDRAPGPRIVPRPPERPASLKPPAQASAPAQTIAPLPSAPATPAVPAPGTAEPAAPAKPALINPQDVRGTGEAERRPPLASAAEPVISVAPVQLPPVQIEDMTTAQPRPETPAVPVTPLD